MSDLSAEREIDLGRWKQAVADRWWIVVAGLVAGAVVGALYSLSGGSVWEASVLLTPSQAFSPSGAPVLSYQSSPRAINELATESSTLAIVAKKAHTSVNTLQGHVSTSTVSTGSGSSTAARGAVLIKLTVQLPKEKETAAAADALGAFIAKQSTGKYVTASIATLQQDLKGNRAQLKSVEAEVAAYQAALKGVTDPFNRLVLTTQQDNAILREGNLNDKIEAQTQQLTLTQSIEQAQVISATPSTATKTTARSRRNSILVGLLIGLIVGAIVAIVVQSRARGARSA